MFFTVMSRFHREVLPDSSAAPYFFTGKLERLGRGPSSNQLGNTRNTGYLPGEHRK